MNSYDLKTGTGQQETLEDKLIQKCHALQYCGKY